MANPIVKSPFSDAYGRDSVPTRGTGKGLYNSEPGMTPGPDTHELPELLRDTNFGDPKLSGPITHSPMKDAVS